MLVVGLGLAARHVLWRTDTDHHGGVLTVIVANEFWFPAGFNAFDPAIQNSEWHSRLAAMTNNGLVGFRRAGGSHGAEIVPDLATTMPTRTNGGLTYTFYLRKGLRYSIARSWRVTSVAASNAPSSTPTPPIPPLTTGPRS